MGRLKQDLDKNLQLHRIFCYTEIILHCVSVSNQLQQWTNFCANFSPNKWPEWGTRPPVEKSGAGTPSPRVSAPLYPCKLHDAFTGHARYRHDYTQGDSDVILFHIYAN